MMSRVIKVAGCVLFLSGAALTAGQGGTVNASAATGERLYHVRGCVGCHEALGTASSRSLVSLAGTANDYRLALRGYRSGDAEHPTLTHGASRLTDDEIGHLAEFLSVHAPPGLL